LVIPTPGAFFFYPPDDPPVSFRRSLQCEQIHWHSQQTGRAITQTDPRAYDPAACKVPPISAKEL
jgi:hypothetical protein